MSGEFSALSDATGLDTAFWSGRLGVPEAQVESWREPNGNPPRAVIDLLDGALEWQQGHLDQLEGTARSGRRVHLLRFPDELDFISTYGDSMPWKAYERLIALAYARLRSLQLPAVLHDFDAAAYHQWRGHRPDTAQSRAEWLSGQSDAAADLAAADQLIAQAFRSL